MVALLIWDQECVGSSPVACTERNNWLRANVAVVTETRQQEKCAAHCGDIITDDGT